MTYLVYTFAAALDKGFEPVSVGRDSLEFGQGETGSEGMLEVSPKVFMASLALLTSGVLDPSSYLT